MSELKVVCLDRKLNTDDYFERIYISLISQKIKMSPMNKKSQRKVEIDDIKVLTIVFRNLENNNPKYLALTGTTCFETLQK